MLPTSADQKKNWPPYAVNIQFVDKVVTAHTLTRTHTTFFTQAGIALTELLQIKEACLRRASTRKIKTLHYKQIYVVLLVRRVRQHCNSGKIRVGV